MADQITPEQLFECHRWIRLDEVDHLPGNPNQGDSESLDRSLDRFGWFQGIVVHEGTIIAGNHRVDKARARNQEGLPGYDLSGFPLADAERMAMALTDNHTARAGHDDLDLLAAAHVMLADVDLALADVAGLVDPADAMPNLDGNSKLFDLTYAVLIDCASEEDQRDMMGRFIEEGLTVRAITT